MRFILHCIPLTTPSKNQRQWVIRGFIFLLVLMSLQVRGAGHLVVEQAWIREAPPGAMMHAGYAVLRNDGDVAIDVSAVQSKGFGDVSIHETVLVNGISKMHELKGLQIASASSVTLMPGGKHLMLMDATAPVVLGLSIEITLILGDGKKVTAPFMVRTETPSIAPR